MKDVFARALREALGMPDATKLTILTSIPWDGGGRFAFRVSAAYAMPCGCKPVRVAGKPQDFQVLLVRGEGEEIVAIHTNGCHKPTPFARQRPGRHAQKASEPAHYRDRSCF